MSTLALERTMQAARWARGRRRARCAGLSGFAGLDEDYAAQLAKDQETFRWTGPAGAGTKVAGMALAAVRDARAGRPESAGRAYAAAEGLAATLPTRAEQEVARDLLNRAGKLLAEIVPDPKALQVAFEKAQQAAAAGSTAEAWQRELEDREATQWAEDGQLWAYGLSYLPGGHGAVKTGKEGAKVVGQATEDLVSAIPTPFKVVGVIGGLVVGGIVIRRIFSS